MRRPSLISTAAAAAVLLAGAFAPAAVGAQQQGTPGPYKAVVIQLPKPVEDPTFEPFRKQLAEIAEKEDRAALAGMVSQSFFWIPEASDAADKTKPPIDNLARAIGLDDDDSGWGVLASFASEDSADPHPERAGVICAPGSPTFDEKEVEELVNTTQTDPYDWGFPERDGIEVRSADTENAPVIDKLGLHLVRVYPDDAADDDEDALRIVTPAGKVGYVPGESIRPLDTDRLCYVKEGNAWKIAGVMGGDPN